jgi:hypothetical protein
MASTITHLLILLFTAQLALSSMDVVIPLELRKWWDDNPDCKSLKSYNPKHTTSLGPHSVTTHGVARSWAV